MNPPPPSDFDPRWLDGLDALAEQSIGLSEPNPRVACRIITLDGRAFEGHTQQAGGPHAEVMALRAAAAAGADLRGGSAVVTLEPCSHHGRTPPCCEALIEAGLARVLVALPDPNPLVGGRGIARLRAAGIEVQVLPPEHPLAAATRELNVGFLSRMERGRPWVRLKVATSLDGRTALPNGASQWITGADARTDGHRWRRRADALLTGIGTVRADDPRLDVRLVPTARQPVRVLLDAHLAVDPKARMLQPPGPVWLYCATPADKARAASATAASAAAASAASAASAATHRATLQALGVQVIDCPAAGTPLRLDLAHLLRDLAAREINELHLEAGPGLNGAFLRAGLVDELLLYLAPTLLGPGAPLAQLDALQALSGGLVLAFTDCTPIGPDLRIRARVLPRPAGGSAAATQPAHLPAATRF